ncbi:MAG: hypothetical protein HUU15_19705 [Candidatus Brocadiae bacterium]|nr:hypothetical protein [Candidatus Brocadiia bacterium]
MRFAAALCSTLALSAVLLADDKVGKTPAPQLLTRCTQDLRKQPGYHFKYSGSVGEQSLETAGVAWQSGLVKQTAGDGLEIWRREKAAFAKDKSGRYVGAASQGEQAQAIVNSPTPDGLLGEALSVAKVARYVQDEQADGVDCKVIECQAPEAKLRDYMEQAAKYWRPEYAKYAKNLQLDKDESYMIYRVFVGKEDLVIRRIVRDTKIKVADSVLKSMPQLEMAAGGMSQVLTVELSRHGEVAEEVIPDEIKKLLQVK